MFEQEVDEHLIAAAPRRGEEQIGELLAQRPGLSNSELARGAFVTRQSMNVLLQSLERQGLVVRPAQAPVGRALPAELTSIRSPRVKAARQLAKRALRQRAREFLAEGPQAVSEALAAGGVVTQLFVTAAAQARYANLIGLAAGQGADVYAVSGEVMTELAQTITPQGVPAASWR